MQVRIARRNDLEAIVAMIAADKLGQTREDYRVPLPDCYIGAFEAIEASDSQELLVAELDGQVVGTLHLTFVQTLTYRGGLRAQIEGVRIHEDHRGGGHGRTLITAAIDRAKSRGAHLVELTSDKTRTDAARFYSSLGFANSHEGMKLHFPS